MAAPAIRLFLNGEAHTVANADPDMTLLQFIRSHGASTRPRSLRCAYRRRCRVALTRAAAADLTGTKSGCGAGLCGACTVMLSHFQDGRIMYAEL